METAIAITIFCSIFSAPDFYLNKARKKTACKSLEQVYKQSEKAELSPTLIMSLIFVESGWRKKAVSHKDACGLTQVLPRYTGRITKKYTCDQLKNPKISIMVGTKTLKWWINYHNGDIQKGLCGYNAGFRCGKKGKKPNKLGMKYAKKVLDIQKEIESKASRMLE